MGFGAILFLASLTAAAPPAQAESNTPATAASTAALPAPVATRQNLFAIPFRIERADQPSREPVEVQLYVSGDQGAHRHLYSRTDPSRRQFLFRAGCDGEFWFQVRTLDRSGKLRPEGFGSPELRVVVDTVPPKLQLAAERGPDGQITARWEIQEPNPKPESMTIQYRTTTDGPWLPVALDRQNGTAAGPTQTGEVTWRPQATSGTIQIRAEVSDAAGNPAVSHAQVNLDQGPAIETSRTAATPASPPRTGAIEGPKTSWPAETPSRTEGAVAAKVNPPVRSQYVPPQDQLTAPAASDLPAAERPRMVNSRLFELEYDVESVGPSGIARVELFGTKDGGRTWKSYAIDNDNRSPILVSVDDEGLYGFRLVVQSGAGLGAASPKPGDTPETWIAVDLTKPTARIISAEEGSGADAASLIITWEASDKYLAPRAITLLFSEGPGGPWTTLAAGLENTGRYVWNLDGRQPQRVYLRLEARDEAGNVGVFETNEAVVLDRSRPSVHIRDVRPLGQTSRAQPRRYYFR